jgi:hypothetical protein
MLLKCNWFMNCLSVILEGLLYNWLIDTLKVITGIGRSREEFCVNEMYAVWRWGGWIEYGSSFPISTWSLQRGCSCSYDSQVT